MKNQKEKIFKVRESERSLTYWHYIVKAKDKTQALQLIYDGEADCYKKTESFPIKVYDIKVATKEEIEESKRIYGRLE